jgi:mono/diheme cytochrome c family protein
VTASRILLAACAVAWTAGLGACSDAAEPPSHLRIAGGEPEQGRTLIYAYGCGTCHIIEGIRGARGTVGPSLADYAERTLLAGILPNTPRHLVPWLMDPVALDHRTGMPALGLTEPEARHIAAYLYTLGAARTQVAPGGPPLELRGREEPGLQAGGQPVGGPDRANATPRTRFMEQGGGRRD